MRKVFETIHKVADTDLTVLVRGESGTGKELVAQALHQQQLAQGARSSPSTARPSPRARRERALRPRKGRVHRRERAARRSLRGGRTAGTLFLDEIGDMPLATQAKLLRVLEERTFERVGGRPPRRGRRARHRRDAPRSRSATSKRGALPRGSLLPPARSSQIALPPLRERHRRLAAARRALPRAARRAPRIASRRASTPSALARARAARTGPATCASSATSSSRRRCWPPEPSSSLDDLPALSPKHAPSGSDEWARRVGRPPACLSARRSDSTSKNSSERFLLAALREHDGNVSRTARPLAWSDRACSRKSVSSGYATKKSPSNRSRGGPPSRGRGER